MMAAEVAEEGLSVDKANGNEAPSFAGRDKFCLALLCVVSTIYLSCYAYRDWIPTDEGLLGETAERVLWGQVPHRDFDDVYSGALAYWHAAAFALLGIKLASLRTALLVVSIPYVAALYWIARRMASPMIACVVAATCVAWSLPNYFAPLPSWFNLILAVWGAAALLRYSETRRVRWLAGAGMCAGISVCFKIVGLYYLAAAALWLCYFTATDAELSGRQSPRGVRAMMTALMSGVVILLTGLVAVLVRRHWGVMVWLQFVAPTAMLGGLLVWRQWQRATDWTQLWGLIRKQAVLFGGAAVPLALFVGFFAYHGAVAQLVRGVFVTPQLRIENVEFPLPRWELMSLTLPFLALLAAAFTRAKRWRWVWTGTAGCCLLFSLGLGALDVVRLNVITAVRLLPPVVIGGFCWVVLRGSKQAAVAEQRTPFLMASLLALTVLVQYPFAVPVYFYYAAPFLVLTLAAILNRAPHGPAIRMAMMGYLLVFGVVWLNPYRVFRPGDEQRDDPAVQNVAIERAGIRLSARDREQYEPLVAFIQQHSAPDSTILAATDCPEIYFLAARRNPTPIIYYVFRDPEWQRELYRKLLENGDVELVVARLDQRDPPEAHAMLRMMLDYFPKKQRFGQFVVGYREENVDEDVTRVFESSAGEQAR